MEEHEIRGMLTGTIFFKFEDVVAKIEVISTGCIYIIFSDIAEPMHCTSITQVIYILNKYLNIDCESGNEIRNILEKIVGSINKFQEGL